MLCERMRGNKQIFEVYFNNSQELSTMPCSTTTFWKVKLARRLLEESLRSPSLKAHDLLSVLNLHVPNGASNKIIAQKTNNLVINKIKH